MDNVVFRKAPTTALTWHVRCNYYYYYYIHWTQGTVQSHCHCIVMCELLCTFFFVWPSDEEEDDAMRLPSFVVTER